MLTLTYPSALLALLGLSVPLALYLWNRRPGPEVSVGSLRWLVAGAHRRLRRLKPEQLGLLLLRAALLGALAVAVAGPAWRRGRPAGRGQVLVGPELAGTPALAAARPALDSLRRRGYALRWLAPGLPAVAPDSLGRYRGPGAGNFAWARVRQAADSFPGQSLRVVVAGTLRALAGPHPPLPAAVRWQLLNPAPPAAWLQEAAGTADSLHLLLGHGTAARTAFRAVAVARPGAGGALRVPGLPPLRYATAPDGAGLLQAGTGSGPATAVAGPLRAAVFAAPAHAEEARYLRAALRAAALGLPAPLVLSATTTAAPPVPPGAPGWLFWLSDAPVPAAWRAAVARGAHVWQAAAGPGVADTAALVAVAATAPVAVFRRARTAPAASGEPLWADGAGRAVLVRRAVGRGAFYALATRLQPAWSELADSPALPALLLEVLRPAPATAVDAPDQRRFDPAQLGAGTGGGYTLPATAFDFLDLRPWLVLLAALLFAVERGLARRAAASSSAA